MNKNTTGYIIVILFVAALGALIWSGQREKPLIFFQDTNVACLPNGHQDIEVHIHPELSIFVDGELEIIPANIGIEGVCMAEIHTHDVSGIIHVETADRQRLSQITLQDFFTVWGEEVEREGFALEILQDGELKESVDGVELIDGSDIVFNYTSLEAEVGGEEVGE